MSNKNKKGIEDYTYYLEILSRSQDRHHVFDDFLTLVVCCLSMQQEEEEYLRTIRRYDKQEVELFTNAFASLVMCMSENLLCDQFGRYFEEFLSNGKNGQFFTPESVSDLMAEISLLNAEDGQSVSDPTCGSGRLFLSAAKVNRNLFFYGSDISLTCCKMTLINLCLFDLQGEIMHQDALNLKAWQRWKVGRHPVFNVPFIQKIGPNNVEEIKECEIKPLQVTQQPQRKFVLFRKNA